MTRDLSFLFKKMFAIKLFTTTHFLCTPLLLYRLCCYTSYIRNPGYYVRIEAKRLLLEHYKAAYYHYYHRVWLNNPQVNCCLLQNSLIIMANNVQDAARFVAKSSALNL